MTILYHEEPTTAEPTSKDGTTRPALGIRVVGFEVKAYRFPPLLFISFVELGRVLCALALNHSLPLLRSIVA